MAEADDSTMDVSFLESIPEIEQDARCYCYINGVDSTADITKICHSPSGSMDKLAHIPPVDPCHGLLVNLLTVSSLGSEYRPKRCTNASL